MSFIRRLGDPVLKSSATPVDRFDDSLRRQVARMAGIMNDASASAWPPRSSACPSGCWSTASAPTPR